LGAWATGIGPTVLLLCLMWLYAAKIILSRHRAVLAARAQPATK
jgi:hypothetical protein